MISNSMWDSSVEADWGSLAEARSRYSKFIVLNQMETDKLFSNTSAYPTRALKWLYHIEIKSFSKKNF